MRQSGSAEAGIHDLVQIEAEQFGTGVGIIRMALDRGLNAGGVGRRHAASFGSQSLKPDVGRPALAISATMRSIDARSSIPRSTARFVAATMPSATLWPCE